MKETVVKAVTDAFIELKLGDIIERLDRRVSTLADRLASTGNSSTDLLRHRTPRGRGV
jgi:hypothetical protein